MTGDAERAVCDLSRAYKEENGVRSCVRKVFLDREKGRVTVSDAAAFEGKKRITIDFYTPEEPKDLGSGALVLGPVRMMCRGIAETSVAPETRADAKITKVWGPLWRITLSLEAENAAAWEIVFEEA